MAKFTDLIPENVAPECAERIGIYKPRGLRLGSFPVGHLALPDVGEKLYSFGALSDVHISYDTALSDFQTALTWLQDTEKVSFNCICGDLTVYNRDDEWGDYAACVAQYSAGTPVYPVAGNHDCYGSGMTDARFRQYTGQDTFYTFTQGEDVFIMLSQIAWPSASGGVQPFGAAGLQRLYETLEENRNRRCFVFQHNFPWGGSGDPFGLYSSNAFWGTQGQVVYSLMEHYPNALWFHGHSHQKFQVQRLHTKANYDFDRGCHSIHIPSLAMPVDVVNGSRVEEFEGSQGYVVDVYEHHVVLRGRNFAEGQFLPLARYCLDTTLKEIKAGAFEDDTGTIVV